MDNFGVNPRGPISNGFYTPEIASTGGYPFVHLMWHVNAVPAGGGGGGNVEVKTQVKFLNDQAAIDDGGLEIGDYYLLAKGNDYGVAEGIIKQLSEPE